MTFLGYDLAGKVVELGDPAELSLSYDRDAPADLLRVKFPADSRWKELAEVRIVERGSTFFRGIVDEQNATLSASGLQVELICRGMEALLLDNEAAPETVLSPALPTLEKKLLTPVGLTLGRGDRGRKPGKLTIGKGDSCWTALAGFCRDFLGTTPYVDEAGVVHCESAEPKKLRLSHVLSAELHQKPCKYITQVWKQNSLGGYDTLYQGSRPGVCRRRYVSMESGRDPRSILAKGERESFLLTVTCQGAVWGLRDALVTVTVPGAGTFTDCPVQSARYRRDRAGERTTLVLERGKEEDYVADTTTGKK